MMTAAQMRAARSLLRWSGKQLAQESGVSLPTIQRMEAADGIPPGLSRTLGLIQDAFERAGIIFIDEDDHAGPGVRLQKR